MDQIIFSQYFHINKERNKKKELEEYYKKKEKKGSKGKEE